MISGSKATEGKELAAAATSKDLANETLGISSSFDGCDDSDESDDSTESDASTTGVNSPSNACPMISEFITKKITHDLKGKFARSAWRRIRRKLKRTLLEFLSTLRQQIFALIKEVKALRIDCSPLEEALDPLFDKADAYTAVKLKSDKAASTGNYAKRLSDVKGHLQNCKDNHTTETNKLRTTWAELEFIGKEMANLQNGEKTLSEAADRLQQTLCRAKKEIELIEEDILALDKAAFLKELSSEDEKTILKSVLQSIFSNNFLT